MAEPGVLRPESPGGPSGFPPFSNEGRFRQERGYETHYYQPQIDTVTGFLRRDAKFNGSGDHLTVLHIEGGSRLAVKLGQQSNRFIPVFEGDVITRPFETFTVRYLDTVQRRAPAVPWTRALFATSYGPLLKRATPRSFDFEPGMITLVNTINTTPLDLLGEAAFATSFPALTAIDGRPSLLRYGGTLRIHNRAIATSVFIFQGFTDPALAPGIPGAGVANVNGWEILPGQKEEFRFRACPKVHLGVPEEPSNLSQRMTLMAATTVGTAELACLFSSSSRDYNDEDRPIANPSDPTVLPWTGI